MRKVLLLVAITMIAAPGCGVISMNLFPFADAAKPGAARPIDGQQSDLAFVSSPAATVGTLGG